VERAATTWRSSVGNVLADVRIYRRLAGARARAQMQYRGSFAITLVILFLGLATEFVAVLILLDRFGALAGWSVGEVAFLFGLAYLAFGLSEMFASGFDVFPNTIRRGEFDQVLLRPVSTFTQTMAADFQLRRLARITQAFVVLTYAFTHIDVDWTIEKALYLPLVVLSGVVMYFSLFVFGAVLCFWTVQSIELINSLTNGGTELTSYPLPIYSDLMQRFFTFVIPLAFISYFPALFLLDRPEANDYPGWLPLLTPVAALLLAIAARAAWGFGVRHYRSTGS
jgi:ABC-2 type transport system permease protein